MPEMVICLKCGYVIGPVSMQPYPLACPECSEPFPVPPIDWEKLFGEDDGE